MDSTKTRREYGKRYGIFTAQRGVCVTKDQDEWLKSYARANDCSVGEVIRYALDLARQTSE
ncbi:hypothetical protein QOZ89_19565 [Pseudofrankia sp. BMG5.37]|nr:hypothetical protein [Pseudofrankia sp. BMG5.37]